MTHTPATRPLEEGDRAPDFTLPSDDGHVSLSERRGEWVVLYFYPKDFTGGCTQEACEFRDRIEDGALQAAVIGVSPDDPETHRRFRQEHGLGFTLATDEDHEVAKAYGAYGNKGAFGMGVKRSTFIIDPEGDVAKAYYNVRAAGHAAQVAQDLAELREQRA